MDTIDRYYLLVYQGGHHDVWCNGKYHITFLGDRFGTAPINLKNRSAEVRKSLCDCKDYKPRGKYGYE